MSLRFTVFTVVAMLTLSLTAHAAPEVLVSVVSSSNGKGSTLPGWKEVTGKIAGELKRRRYAVRLGNDVIDRGKLDSWSKLAGVNTDQSAALGIVVLLPVGTDQPTLVFVADRVTGKGLQRVIAPSSDLTSSTIALAAVELLEASLIELYTEHTTTQPEVPKPVDLPMPEVPRAPAAVAWSVTLEVGAWWPIRIARPTDQLRIGLHRSLTQSAAVGFEVFGSAIGESSTAAVGTIHARPFGLGLVVDLKLVEFSSWHFGVSPFAELAAVVTNSSVLEGYRASEAFAPMLAAGARLSLARELSASWAIGFTLGAAGVISGPVLQVDQTNVLDFSKATVTAAVRAQYRW